MELMDTDLERYIFGGLKFKEKIQILKDTSEGLDFLHNSSVVHRDIKPKNILLNKKLEAKLTDLGIAKALEDK